MYYIKLGFPRKPHFQLQAITAIIEWLANICAFIRSSWAPQDFGLVHPGSGAVSPGFGAISKEAGEFWWTSVNWRRPVILGPAILEYNERNWTLNIIQNCQLEF